MSALLCAIFFLSGAAGLVFETLWFHQAGLVFGNGVWASSLVLAAFMAGLALGNAAAARYGSRITRPVRWYASLEAVIAASGVGLVLGLPLLTPLLAPLLRPVSDVPGLVNLLRLGVGFLLMLIPSTAMGATLPLLVKALLARDSNFGAVLGRLYGWNTLGAVSGALLTEAVLIEAVGIRGSAGIAAALNVVVAVAGVAISGAFLQPTVDGNSAKPPEARTSARARLWLAAAFISGFTLLALEIVWFRFLQLWVHGSSLAFAIMLATVLTGIACGGFVGGGSLRRWPEAYRRLPALALVAMAAVGGSYRAYAVFPTPSEYAASPWLLVTYGLVLMGPVSFLSGIAFTWIGAAVEREVAPPTRAAGWMTFWNTLGSGAGPLLAGFVLLPLLGMERSFLLLSLPYAAVAALAWFALEPRTSERRRWIAPAIGATVAVALVLTFPLGRMLSEYIPRAADRLVRLVQGEITHIEEGRTETVVLVERQLLDLPVWRMLITNGHSMTGDAYGARRYMNLYAHFPGAFHPDPKRALLISYGLGSTGRALLDVPGVESVDVVDISREILGLSRRLFPPKRDPLQDPRVRVHVEDGRYFLQLTDRGYDIITGEPPPPKNAGVVNLYTREYFELVRDRLAPGGIHTYWLPVHEFHDEEARAIVQAYCDVFDDCSLWIGAAMDWMLVGSRGADWSANAERFAAQWEDPVAARELAAIGFEEPAQMAATFLMDPTQLKAFAGTVPPLIDDFPKRLSDDQPNNREVWPIWAAWLTPERVLARFDESRWLRDALPPAVHARARELLPLQHLVNQIMAPVQTRSTGERYVEVHRILTETPFEVLALWDLGTSARAVEIAERERLRGTRQLEIRAIAALSRRHPADAARMLRQLNETHPTPRRRQLELFALGMAGRISEAEAVARAAAPPPTGSADERSFRDAMQQLFGMRLP